MEELFGAVAGLALTVVMAGLATFFGVWLFERATRGIADWAELRSGNVAIGMIMASFVVAVGIIVRPALQEPLIAADLGRSRPLYELMVSAIGVVIALLLAVGAVGLALWLFTRLTTDLDEWAELKDGNNAVAVLMAGVILAIALLTATAVERILGALTDLVK